MDWSSMLRRAARYARIFCKWLLCAGAAGLVCGLVGSSFYVCVDRANVLRAGNSWLLFLLPLAGLLIVLLYRLLRMEDDGGTNHIFEAIRTGERVPLRMAPLIYIGTVLTHICGGSAGKEGAALQIGGSVSAYMGKLLRFDEKDMRLMTLCGMSAVFSAVFCTPLTAALFCLEVISVGVIYYSALVPCLISALAARLVSAAFGIGPMPLGRISVDLALEIPLMLRVLALSVLCALVSIAMCAAFHSSAKLMKRALPNSYLRAALGGLLVVGISLLLGTDKYNGAGVGHIIAAVEGTASGWDFVLKLLLTAISLGAGFKGGEIVPTMFIGSTFGCFAGGLLGLEPGLAASIGLVAVFCGVVNCPISSIILSVELFGGQGMIYFAIACAVSYMLSGRFSLYAAQRIVYSKLEPTYINAQTH